jgi:hypothetical protein
MGVIPGQQQANQAFSIYGDSPSLLFQYAMINHRAYLYAPITGDYEITVPYSDDITLVWVGPNAYTAYTRQNANLEQTYVQGGTTAKTVKVRLVEGSYTPFRVMWANAQGNFAFLVEVKAPNGDIIVNGEGSAQGYLLRFACSPMRDVTPDFPAFGARG